MSWTINLSKNQFFFFVGSGSLMARIHLIRWISGVSTVRTPAPAYNNALSYQLSYAHGTVRINSKGKVNCTFKETKLVKINSIILVLNLAPSKVNLRNNIWTTHVHLSRK
jgi:hypothetical protein